MIDLSTIHGNVRVQVNEWNRPLSEWRDVLSKLKAQGKTTHQLRAKLIKSLRADGHLD